jgi:hypothetical protein
MIRKIKTLGFALVAVMAMAAFSAATASAEFHSVEEHTIIDGEQPATVNDVFTVNAGTVTCNTATYTGTTTTKTTSEITVTPTYSGCTAFGFVNATVDVNNCHYTFTTTTTDRLHIVCPTAPITVTAFNCWVTVGSQTASGVTYKNTPEEHAAWTASTTRDVDVTANITGLTYTQHSKSFPGCTNGTFTNGSYKGGATVKGTDTKEKQISIWTSHAS